MREATTRAGYQPTCRLVDRARTIFKRRQSLFDQSLDRPVFVTYFLGAVVPFIGFAVLGERFAPLLTERNEQIAVIATVVATGVLCLGSFLALRLIVLRTVQDMLQQHDRLEPLLWVAQDLAEAAHTQMVTETVACWAQRLTWAEASWVLIREMPDKPFTVDCQRGTQAAEWLEANQDEWMDLVERALETGEALQIDGQRGTDLSTAFLPLARSSKRETTASSWLRATQAPSHRWASRKNKPRCPHHRYQSF